MASEKQMLKLISDYRKVCRDYEIIRTQRARMRDKIIDETFPKLAEGSNRVKCPGFDIVVNHKINRDIDPVLLVEPGFVRQCKLVSLSVDDLLRWKPELQLRPYKALEKNQQRVFDRVLEIKPGGDTLSLE